MLLFFVGIERAVWVDLLSPGQVILHWPFSLVFFPAGESGAASFILSSRFHGDS